MRLIRCYIENFGTLSRFSQEFSDGLNTICEENGWGKSTLAVFIKAMFYGLPATTKKLLDENDRKKYAPWSGGKFGGNIDFVWDGKGYRIERYFGDKEANDTFRLFDTATNKESFAFSSDIGAELFRMDADAYERSTYLPQRPIDWQINDSIKTKLTNLIDDTDDINNYKRALDRIDKKRIYFEKQGGDRGRITVLEQNRERLKAELADAERGIKSFGEKENAKIDTEAEIEKTESDYSRLKSELQTSGMRAGQKAHYNLLKRDFDETAEQEKELSIFFAAGVPDEKTIGHMNAQLVEYAAIRKTADKIAGSPEGMLRLLKTPLLQGIGAALVFLGLILWVTNLSVVGGIFSLIVGVAVLSVAAVLFIKTKRTQSMYKQTDDIKNEISGFLEKYIITEDVADFAASLATVAQKKSALDALTEARRKKEEALAAFTEENNKDGTLDSATEPAQELHEKLQKAESRLSELRKKNNLLEYDIETLAECFGQKIEIEARLSTEAEELVSAKRQLKALRNASKYLEKAHDNLSTKYIGAMQNSFGDFARNFGNIFSGFAIDPDLQIKIEKSGEAKDIAAFSAGLRNLVNIGLRLSLVDAMFEGEKPFIIFDDPFINLSDVNLAKMKTILEEISKKYQIIHFVCHSARK